MAKRGTTVAPLGGSGKELGKGQRPLKRATLIAWVLGMLLGTANAALAQSPQQVVRVTGGLRGLPTTSSLGALRSLEGGMTIPELAEVYQLWTASDPELRALLLEQTVIAATTQFDRSASGLWTPGEGTTCATRLVDGDERLIALDGWFRQAELAVPPPDFSQLFHSLPELRPAAELLTEEARRMLEACGRDEACLRRTVAQTIESGALQRTLGRLCLAQNSNALKGTVISWLLHVGALSSAYALSDEPRYPFDLLVADTVTILLYWEIGCRGQFQHAPGTPRFKRWAKTYWTYLKWTPMEVLLYPGAAMTYDAISGEEVLSDEKIREYISQGMFVFAWNVAFGHPLEVIVMDPLYLRAFPSVRTRITDLIERGIVSPLTVRNGTLGRLVAGAAPAPGYAVETGLQWLLGTGHSWLFMKGRAATVETVAPWLPVFQEARAEGESPPPELPLRQAPVELDPEHPADSPARPPPRIRETTEEAP